MSTFSEISQYILNKVPSSLFDSTAIANVILACWKGRINYGIHTIKWTWAIPFESEKLCPSLNAVEIKIKKLTKVKQERLVGRNS